MPQEIYVIVLRVNYEELCFEKIILPVFGIFTDFQ
jgi:hypothetical protein